VAILVPGKKDIAVVGYGETPVGLRTGRSSYDLAAEAFELVLQQSGIDKSEIDGVCFAETMSETSNPFWAVFLCEHHCKPEDVRIGLPVKVCWERLTDEINHPAFESA
jgi:hypothetical protein